MRFWKKAMLIFVSSLLTCGMVPLFVSGAGTETFTDSFGEKSPSLENVYDTNMSATYDKKGSETFYCVQKASHDGTGFLTYSFEGKKIESFSFRAYYMNGFLYAGMDNRYMAYVLEDGSDEYKKVELQEDVDEGTIIENGAYSVTSSVISPAKKLTGNIIALKLVVDPVPYNYVNYTIRIRSVTMELSAYSSETSVPEESNSALFVPGETKTVERETYTETRYEKFKTSFGKTFDYSIAFPKDFDESKSYPVILYLHGLGGDTDFNIYENFLQYVFADYKCIVIAPLAYRATEDYWIDYAALYENRTEDGLVANYTQSKYKVTDALRFAKELYAQTCKTYSISHSFIVGYSMGAYGTWEFITRFPGLMDAAVPVSGAGDFSLAASLVDLPLWGFHGDADATVYYRGTKDMCQAIKDAGGTKVKYTEYPGGDHGICYKAYIEALPWLFGTIMQEIPAYEHKVEEKTDEPASSEEPGESSVYPTEDNSADLNILHVESEEPVGAPEPDESSASADEPAGSSSLPAWIFAGAGIALLVVAIVLLIIFKKRG